MIWHKKIRKFAFTLFGECTSMTTRGLKRECKYRREKGRKGDGETARRHARSCSQRGPEEGWKVKLSEIGRGEKRGCAVTGAGETKSRQHLAESVRSAGRRVTWDWHAILTFLAVECA